MNQQEVNSLLQRPSVNNNISGTITLTSDEARRLRELRHAVGEFVLHNCNHEDDIVVAWQDVADIKLGGAISKTCGNCGKEIQAEVEFCSEGCRYEYETGKPREEY